MLILLLVKINTIPKKKIAKKIWLKFLAPIVIK